MGRGEVTLKEQQERGAEVTVVLEAGSLEELFAEASRALCDCITTDDDVMAREARVVELEAANRDELMLAWLRELIAVFASEELVFSRARVEVRDAGADGAALAGHLWGEPFDAARHRLKRPIDSVDPRALRISRNGDRWRTRLSCWKSPPP
jgi:SHS2 domain-containing protein